MSASAWQQAKREAGQENAVLHWALGQIDIIGRPMYAHLFGREEGGQVYLSHRPREAAQFASEEEAEAQRVAWAGRIDWARYDESATPRTQELTVIAITKATLRCVYPDGSGLALEALRNAIAHIERYESHCVALRRFIELHRATLDGTGWTASCYHDAPQISFAWRAYDGHRTESAYEVASLWPVVWTREKQKYPREGYAVHDWHAKLDGVDLLIEGAESVNLRPVDVGRDGTVVQMAKPKRKAVAA